MDKTVRAVLSWLPRLPRASAPGSSRLPDPAECRLPAAQPGESGLDEATRARERVRPVPLGWL